jgi:hypothetical protein
VVETDVTDYRWQSKTSRFFKNWLRQIYDKLMVKKARSSAPLIQNINDLLDSEPCRSNPHWKNLMNSSSPSSSSWFRPCLVSSVLLKRMLVPTSPYEFCNIMLTSRYSYVNQHPYERLRVKSGTPLFILWIESFKTYSNVDSIKFWNQEMKHVLQRSFKSYLLYPSLFPNRPAVHVTVTSTPQSDVLLW